MVEYVPEGNIPGTAGIRIKNDNDVPSFYFASRFKKVPAPKFPVGTRVRCLSDEGGSFYKKNAEGVVTKVRADDGSIQKVKFDKGTYEKGCGGEWWCDGIDFEKVEVPPFAAEPIPFIRPPLETPVVSLVDHKAGSGYPDDNPKTAMGLAKPSYRHCPTTSFYIMGQVMATGAAKYGPFNWRQDRITASTYVDAARRHLDQLADGARLDPESNLPHAAHVMACMALLLDAAVCDKLNDDLPKEPGPLTKWLADNTQKKAA